MSNGTGSEALTAKLRAMYGKRLTQQNYRELIRKQNVFEIASYIKQQTSYADALRDVNENSVHRGQLENNLRQQLFFEYTKTLHYIRKEDMDFYDFFLIRMEIDEILSCCRFLNAGRQGEYLFSLPSYFAKHAKFDLFGLAKVKSYRDLLALLENTPYAAILRKFDPEAEDRTDSIRLENEFNRYYYAHVFSVADKYFSGDVLREIRDAFGIEADMTNISLIVRLKKYFKKDSAYIRPLLLPFTGQLKKAELTAMAEAPDGDGVEQVLLHSKYGRTLAAGDYDYIEKFAEHVIYDYNRRLLAFTQSSPVGVVAYLNLKRIELENLISIIEGVRYGQSPAEIEKVVVGVSG